ncbi:MAG: hypothetical protein AB7P40_26490, partial [Chloroflexota bacterium]
MPSRISRRTLIGWLARSASGVAAIGLMRATSEHQQPARTAFAAAGGAASPAESPARAMRSAPSDVGPVPVRMADLVLEGADLRTGQAEGVRLPGQGGADGSLTAERAGGTYTTALLQSEFPCTHVGVHWRTDGEESTRTGVSMELRASRDGQTWTSWRPVQAESHGRDQANQRSTVETFGALAGVRLSNWFQARLTFAAAGPEQPAVTGITLTCLDSRRLAETSGRPLTPRPPLPRAGEGEAFAKAGPVSFLDRVITREAWGADESLRFN